MTASGLRDLFSLLLPHCVFIFSYSVSRDWVEGGGWGTPAFDCQFLGTDKDFARLFCEYFSSRFDLETLSVPFYPHLTPL